VVERAGSRCEYCRLRQEHYPLWLHQVEHIIPKKHFGTDELDNLALACVRCNLGKSSNLTGIDPLTGNTTMLFHPRNDDWSTHFVFRGALIDGLTAIGRVTVYVLNMNEAQRLRLRYRLWENGELD
jgi:hypothetical protein